MNWFVVWFVVGVVGGGCGIVVFVFDLDGLDRYVCCLWCGWNFWFYIWLYVLVYVLVVCKRWCWRVFLEICWLSVGKVVDVVCFFGCVFVIVYGRGVGLFGWFCWGFMLIWLGGGNWVFCGCGWLVVWFGWFCLLWCGYWFCVGLGNGVIDGYRLVLDCFVYLFICFRCWCCFFVDSGYLCCLIEIIVVYVWLSVDVVFWWWLVESYFLVNSGIVCWNVIVCLCWCGWWIVCFVLIWCEVCWDIGVWFIFLLLEFWFKVSGCVCWWDRWW